MTKFRKTLKITDEHDDVIGARKTIIRRVLQPVNKDGRDSKRPAHPTAACLIRYADGSWRYYGRNGVLARERISDVRLAAEMAAPDHDDSYYWDED